MKPRLPVLALLLAVLVPFTVFSVALSIDEGYFGFIRLAIRERWGLQVLLDLCIMGTAALVWMRRDAAERGLPFWPYLPIVMTLGSIGFLAYLIHRTLVGARPVTAGRPVGPGGAAARV